MDRQFREYNFYDLLNLTTNIKDITDFLGFFTAREYCKTGAAKVSISVDAQKKLDIDKKDYRRVGDFYYNQKEDAFYFDHPFIFPAQLLIKGLSSDKITILTTKWFLKLPTILRGGINFTYLFREIMLLKLIEQGFIFLHSACVDIDGSGVIFTAFPNTGKTYLSFGLVKEGHAKLLSDEYTLVNKDSQVKVFLGMSALSPKIIREFKIKITARESLIMGLCRLRASLLPFLFEPVIWVHSTRIFSQAYRKAESKLHYLLFLERGNSGIKPIDKEEAYRKLLLLTENEFPFSVNYFLQAYSYVNKDFDLAFFREREISIIRNITANSKGAFIFSFTPGDIKQLYSIIKENLGRT